MSKADPPLLNAMNLSDQALMEYHLMMTEAGCSVKQLSPLADAIWSEVLRELDLRGAIELVLGNYDDVGSALIRTFRK